MKLLPILLLILVLVPSCIGTPSDDNGNGDPADTTSPIITEVASSDITEISVVITWTTDEPCDSQIEYGDTDIYATSSTLMTTLVTSHTVNLTGLTPETTYHFRVKSSDASGNQAMSDDYSFATLEPDTTAPITSSIAATSTSETRATITWATDEPCDSQVEYGFTTSYGITISPEITLSTTHSIGLAGLEPNTTYHYRVASCDVSGNEVTSTDHAFTTLTVSIGGVGTAEVEDGIVDLLNTERAERGLSALARSDALDILAREYAASQFDSSSDIIYLVYNAWQLSFSLGSPRFDEDTATEQIDYCIDESDMRDALLRAEAMETGMGIATVGNTIYFTQVFDVIRTSGGAGQPIILAENLEATDPTWEQLEAFLVSDTTDEVPYVLGSFICGDYAETLHNSAEAAGIKAAYVSVRLNQEPGHALNAFTIDGTTVFIDVGSADKVAYLQVGKDYGVIALDAAQQFTYTYFETYVVRFEACLVDMDNYGDDVVAFNAEVTSYNDADPVPEVYDTRPEWYEALQSQQDELGARLAELNTEKAALGIGDTYFHPTESLDTDDPSVVDYYVHW